MKDVGAYHYFSVHEPTNTINHLPSQYRVPAFRAEAFSVVTNKVAELAVSRRRPARGDPRRRAPARSSRRQLGLDPAEVRARNRRPHEMPYRAGLVYRDGVPVSYDGGDYPLELRRALELLDYDGWRKRQAELRAQGRHVGLGIAGYLEAGGSVRPGEWATVKVDERGHVEVLIGVSGSGQGHETVFAQVCAEHLGAASTTFACAAATRRSSPTATAPGRAASPSTPATRWPVAAAAVKGKACRVAARLLECDAEDVRIEDGRAFVVGAPEARDCPRRARQAALRDRSLVELGGPGLWATKFCALPTVTWSSGVHVAVVEVDAETGRSPSSGT